MITSPTLKTTIETALELSQIVINILAAVQNKEITADEARRLIDDLLAA